MTDEEKYILMEDLSGRLQHHVVLHFVDEVQQDDEYLYGFRENSNRFLINDAYYIEEVKPYLRPLSTMTYDEEKEYDGIFPYHASLSPFNISQINEWYNKHHFDYRGLIEKGLALEAPKDMYD